MTFVEVPGHLVDGPRVLSGFEYLKFMNRLGFSCCCALDMGTPEWVFE